MKLNTFFCQYCFMHNAGISLSENIEDISLNIANISLRKYNIKDESIVGTTIIFQKQEKYHFWKTFKFFLSLNPINSLQIIIFKFESYSYSEI